MNFPKSCGWTMFLPGKSFAKVFLHYTLNGCILTRPKQTRPHWQRHVYLNCTKLLGCQHSHRAVLYKTKGRDIKFLLITSIRKCDIWSRYEKYINFWFLRHSSALTRDDGHAGIINTKLKYTITPSLDYGMF